MTPTYFKHAGLAAIMLGCSGGLAQAQPPAPLSPAELRALIGEAKPTAAPNGRQIVTGGGRLPGAAAGAASAIVSGWNLQHCYTSVWFTPDNVNFYIFAFNREGTFWFYAVNTPLHASAQEELVNVCRTGQLYGVFVTNTGTGAYDEIWDKW